jgi:rhodanese-related sulfurtransferase
MIKNITPEELSEKIASGMNVFLLDVRQPEEYAQERLPNAYHVPLMDIPNRVQEIKEQIVSGSYQAYVAYCHLGQRSENACHFLHDSGLTMFLNLEGGIANCGDLVE